MSLQNKKENELFIETPELQISNHVITFRDTAIQISNISSVAVCPFPKKAIPSITWALLILGIILLGFNPLLGVLFLAAGGIIIWKIYSDNQSTGQYIKINMNSGAAFFFTADSTIFVKQVAETIAYCINHPDEKRDNVVINITNSKIDNSPLVAGNTKSDIHL